MIRLITPFARIRWTDQFPERFLGTEDPDDVEGLRWYEEHQLKMSEGLLELALRRGVPCRQGLLLTRSSLLPLQRYMDARAAHFNALESDRAHGPQFVAGMRFTESTNAALSSARRAVELVLRHPRDRRIEAHWQALGGSSPAAGSQESLEPAAAADHLWTQPTGMRGRANSR
ncbi:hypothetical protein BG28_09000 [Nesterenkonia sp. AN1]|nr:hypothetical protein BG28_09000 [Nesterenkonia sp. AN1]